MPSTERYKSPSAHLTALALVVALASLGRTAAAFPTGSQFDDDPVASAGGGGVHYTGSPSFAQATCGACHTLAPHQLGLHLNANDTTLFSDGYQPGQTYELQVELVGETLGDAYNGPARCGNLPGKGFVPCNGNAFALEVDDVSGTPTGALCPSQPSGMMCNPPVTATTVLAADGSAIHTTGYLQPDPTAHLPAGFENGAIAWSFYWTAPVAGTGPVTFHIGAVDGNGGEGSADVPQDITGDDTVEAHLIVPEAGGITPVATTGCSLRAGPPRRRAGFFFCLVMLTFLMRRRARS